MTREEFIEKSRKIHGNRYNYGDVVYHDNTSVVTLWCVKHGKFEQPARSHLAGHGCKSCYIESMRRSLDDFIKNSRDVHGDKYDYSRVDYQRNKQKVEVICPLHGPFFVTPNAHVACKTGCMRCKESKGETAIRQYLEKNSIVFIQEYRIDPFLYRYDFYLPEHDILIEFHGQQHFKPVERFGGKDAFEKLRDRDRKKAVVARMIGIKLTVLTFVDLQKSGWERIIDTSLSLPGHDLDVVDTLFEEGHQNS